jgi:hypothetical protein
LELSAVRFIAGAYFFGGIFSVSLISVLTRVGEIAQICGVIEPVRDRAILMA